MSIPKSLTPELPVSEWSYQNARRSYTRFSITFAFWAYGVITLLMSAVFATLLIAVPSLGLENDLWRRPDNHVTLANTVLYLNVGTLCIIASRGSTKLRLWLGLVAVLTMVALGTRDIGIAAW